MTAAARSHIPMTVAMSGLVLAVVTALAMTDPYRSVGFLAVALLRAIVGGAVETSVAGRRALRRASGGTLTS